MKGTDVKIHYTHFNEIFECTISIESELILCYTSEYRD